MVQVGDSGDYRGFRGAQLVGLVHVIGELENIFIGSGVKLFVC